MTSTAHLIRRRRATRKRRRQQRTRQRTALMVTFLLLSLLIVLPLGGGLAYSLSYYASATAGLPVPEDTIYLDAAIGPSQMLDRTGETLIWSIDDPLGAEREWVSLEDVPRYVIDATLLSEDPDFLEAGGFALTVSAQRFVENAVVDMVSQDPTLTGRLVRGTLLQFPDIPTPDDRAREISVVAEVNRLYTPEEILEWHLNTNYYGKDAYGIDAAAQVYFGKPATALTVDEAVLLAAIPTAPQYNPADDEVAARGRQAALLREMFTNGLITQEDYNTATATVTPVRTTTDLTIQIAPEYALYARQQTEDILDSLGYDGSREVSRGGLRIITALDMTLYEQATCTLDAHLTQLGGGPAISPDVCPGAGYLPVQSVAVPPAPDVGAIVVIDTRSGELVAAVGDITAQTREPGVILYPFVYMSGFSSALYTPATMLLDIPQRFPGAADGLIYTPTNPDGQFFGPVSARQAMNTVLLPPTVQIANSQGLDNILRQARLVGLSELQSNTYDLSILERGGGVSVLDAAHAYSVFATLGKMRGVQATIPERGEPPRDPVAVLRIEDAAGNVLWAYENEVDVDITPILDEGLAYLVNDVLSDGGTRSETIGSGNLLETSRPMAVISGAGGDNAATWAVGYSPNLVVSVWVGREDGAELALDPRGLVGAAPVWRAITDYAHDRFGMGADEWQQPDNVVQARVCERSGLRPNGICPERTEIFLENTQPPEIDFFWQSVDINNQTGQLSTANTPSNFREERLFFVPPPEAAEWWEANQLPLPPQEYDTITRPDVVRTSVITSPEVFQYVSGEVPILGSMDAENLQYYQVAYGQGLNPGEWIDIAGQQTDYVPGQPIAIWDTTGLDGLYNLRLTAVMGDNSIDPFLVQVTVDNLTPSITLRTGDPGKIYTVLSNDVIPLVADVEDNVAIARVEFYADGRFVGTDDAFPFGYDHPIDNRAIGVQQFSATVYDAAGNSASTELEVEVQRGGT
jgi:membrane peptidoglycan carboxypeptidase